MTFQCLHFLGVPRKAMQFKHLRLMKYKIAIAHGARTGTVRKAWAAAKIDELRNFQ